MCIYVHDVLLIGDKEAIDQAIYGIEGKFDINKEGSLECHLGCIIKFKDKEGSIHQPHSLKRLEEKLGPLVEGLRKITLSSAPGLNLMRSKNNEELLDWLNIQDLILQMQCENIQK